MSEVAVIVSQFFTIAVAHALAVISPGPDYALILRHSARFGRHSALAASAGIASGILGHTLFAISGISLLLLANPLWLKVLTWCGAGYLLYLACLAWRSRPNDGQQPQTAEPQLSRRSAYWQGLLTNGLNPKALLFFVAIFMVVKDASIGLKLLYGGYMALATLAWFAGLSLVLTRPAVRQWMQRCGHYLDWATGAVMAVLALLLVTRA